VTARSIASAARLLAALLLAAAGAPPASAGEPAPTDDAPAPARERPKIGIAFGGGGAKGGAHVGILKVLEELRIPVDYIAGTSMGAIMGGLYASGMGPDEMHDALFSVDWEDAMSDQTAHQQLSFRRKEDSQRYLLDLELGLRHWRLVWPSGLLTGQKLFFLLQSLTLPVADVSDFDTFSIPFRAVATDIQLGEPVVLSGGNLATAMRASMAIPTIFSPVEIDGRRLVDGGVTDNLPVDVVRAMGADIVIAIDLSPDLAEQQVETMMQIQSQSLRMLTRKNMEPNLEEADIVLVPDVAKYGTLNFGALEEIYAAGIVEAEAKADLLRKLSVSEAEYAEYLARQRRAPRRPIVVDAIRVEGNQRVDSRVITERIRSRAGEELDFEQLAEDLAAIHGLGDFDQVSFSLDRRPESTELVIHTREKPWGPHYLHFGLKLSTDLDGEFRTSVLINLLNTRLNSRGGEVRTDLTVGRARLLSSEYYQPLVYSGRWFTATTFEFGIDPQTFYDEGKAVAETDRQQGSLTLDLGYQIDASAELRLGILRGAGSIKVRSGTLRNDDLSDIDFAGVRLLARLDRLDQIEFPTAGSTGNLRAYASLEPLGADVEYQKLDGYFGEFWSRGKNTFLASLQGKWASDDVPVYDEPTLGGFLSLSGLPDDGLRGRVGGVARVGYYRSVLKNKYIGGWAEAGNMWRDSQDADLSDLIYTGTLFLGAKTRIGPCYFGWAMTSEGNSQMVLIVGRTF